MYRPSDGLASALNYTNMCVPVELGHLVSTKVLTYLGALSHHVFDVDSICQYLACLHTTCDRTYQAWRQGHN